MCSRVRIYTKPYCPYSQRAKDLLRIKAVEFVEHDITEADHAAAEKLPQGQLRSVPAIFIDDILIGGCFELFDLDERGKLDVLLGLAINLGESLP